jgi:signal transduction histidine kinase
MDVGNLRALALFDGTDDARLGELSALGTDVAFAPGEEVFVEGRPADFWWVLLEGRVDLVRHVGREERQLAVMEVPGQWAGGFRAWDEHGAYLATARASTAGRFFCVSAEALRGYATTWFPLGVHFIKGLFGTVRSVESTTRQKEALIALGTLAAGLAHQLNNPAAAATRAADGLAEAGAALLTSLRRLAAEAVTSEQFTALDTLRLQIPSQSGPADPMEVADRESAVADWLAARGVERPWGTAAALARAGGDVAWCERVGTVLPGPALGPGLDWVASTLTSASLLAQVKESTRRISDLVAAARSYSQLDRASMQPTDVAEGLESTLLVLADRIPPEVRVVRDFGADVPWIDAAAAELNQVWTNLVDNALQALAGGGTLRVSTRPDGTGGVVVEIGDTGTGMSPEVQAHAFDPFFTTRAVGEGVGLGLDIARRIVEGHRGEIAIEARDGETVLRVRLPAGAR